MRRGAGQGGQDSDRGPLHHPTSIELQRDSGGGTSPTRAPGAPPRSKRLDSPGVQHDQQPERLRRTDARRPMTGVPVLRLETNAKADRRGAVPTVYGWGKTSGTRPADTLGKLAVPDLGDAACLATTSTPGTGTPRPRTSAPATWTAAATPAKATQAGRSSSTAACSAPSRGARAAPNRVPGRLRRGRRCAKRCWHSSLVHRCHTTPPGRFWPGGVCCVRRVADVDSVI